MAVSGSGLACVAGDAGRVFVTGRVVRILRDVLREGYSERKRREGLLGCQLVGGVEARCVLGAFGPPMGRPRVPSMLRMTSPRWRAWRMDTRDLYLFTGPKLLRGEYGYQGAGETVEGYRVDCWNLFA